MNISKVKCLNTPTIEKKWYVFYLHPRSEKIVYEDLFKKKYEVFLPVIQTVRIWKNRQKKNLEVPLFSGYIFVKAFPSDLYNIKCCPRVVTYIHCSGKPSTIPSKDIEGIKKMLNLDQKISIETIYEKGEKVKITSGPLAGQEGILCERNGKTRFGIQLKEINHTAYVDICTSDLEKV